MAHATAIAGKVQEALGQWAVRQGAVLEGDVRDLGGHSAQTLSFRMIGSDSAVDALVLRLLVPSASQADRDALSGQAKLLQGLRSAGVKVPAVRDVSLDPAPFGAPYMVVEMLAGQPLIMGPEGQPSWLAGELRQSAAELAARELAAIHHRNVLAKMEGWPVSRSPAEEIDHWVKVFDRAAEPAWRDQGLALRDALLAQMPREWTAGFCHGDFQTNNVLFTFERGELGIGGVIDWELAHIGAVELDLAWYLMMNDAQAWGPMELRGGIDLDAILQIYRAETGNDLAHIAWFLALACYRMAAISGYQIRLHRTGRKIDPSWERISSSIPQFFARAHALLVGAPVMKS